MSIQASVLNLSYPFMVASSVGLLSLHAADLSLGTSVHQVPFEFLTGGDEGLSAFPPGGSLAWMQN